MKWFDKWFAKMSKRAWNYVGNYDSPVSANYHKGSIVSLNELGAKTSINFTIYPANGGYVVQHSMYKRHEDTDGPVLTLIAREEDLGESIAHIITLEALRA